MSVFIGSRFIEEFTWWYQEARIYDYGKKIYSIFWEIFVQVN